MADVERLVAECDALRERVAMLENRTRTQWYTPWQHLSSETPATRAVLSALGAGAKETTLEAACRVVAERDQWRKMAHTMRVERDAERDAARDLILSRLTELVDKLRGGAP